MEILDSEIEKKFPDDPSQCQWCKFAYEHPERKLWCPTHKFPFENVPKWLQNQSSKPPELPNCSFMKYDRDMYQKRLKEYEKSQNQSSTTQEE